MISQTPSMSFAAKLLAPVILSIAVAACAPLKKNQANDAQDDKGRPVTTFTTCEQGGPMNVLKPDVVFSVAPRTDHFCALILAIMPEYLGWIENGSKSFEYRKVHPSDHISHIVFFNNGTNELYGIAEVVTTLVGPPQLIAEQTASRSGTNVDGLMGYFGTRPVGFATEIRNFKKFDKPITLDAARNLDPSFKRPFGYVFLDRHPILNAEIEKLHQEP
ncbi:MAG: hypothetical protein IPJ84_00975 [Bdellovibrionales bacterium]|nr:hypothetical protein [Bdellovibrionales bacterium]